MWTSVAFLAALSLPVGEAGNLSLTNVRTTYGILGAPRTDTKFFPGDDFVFAFDAEGVTPDDSGTVRYSIGVEVRDKNGKVKFRQAPAKHEAHNTLGGTKLPTFAQLKIGLDAPPGDYKVKVTFTDLVAKASKSLTRSYTLLPPQFALVRLSTTADAEEKFPLPFPCEGQSLWVTFGTVGFRRDKSTGQPDLELSLRVLDEDGKPTQAKPMKGIVNKDIPAKARGIPGQFMLELNQAGKFTVELKATDKVSGEKFVRTFPLTVLKAK